MAEASLSPEQMAEMVRDVSPSGVLKWVRGERVPRPEQLRRIFEVTQGRVAPNDFILGSAGVIAE